MGLTNEIIASLWTREDEDFVIGKDSFSDLEINSSHIDHFYYFKDKKTDRLIKRFVLEKGKEVDRICEVALIKKGETFTPRLTFCVRDKKKKVVEEGEARQTNIKARVGLDSCHENLWKLLKYLESIKDIEIPKESFSLMSQSEAEITTALQGRDPASILNIIKQLSSTEGVKLSQEDINQLLKRREKLEIFERELTANNPDEKKWQNFFEKNKWIFGYGLNYEILRQEQTQPHYGGTRVEGKGGERGDYLTSTMGDINFTVLVEIKTPATPLLQGTKEVRNGAWSLSKELTDALVQIEANIATWDKDGSTQVDNMDRFEENDIYTVKPKGILVIGSLNQLDTRSKKETFQRFRKSIHGVDILTFDELYNRARFIVDTKD